MKYLLTLSLFFSLLTRSNADYVVLNSLNGSDTGYIKVNGGLSEDVYIDQFHLTYYQSSSGTSTSFNSFCIDLYHNVSINQKYSVYSDSISSLDSNFNNGKAMAYVYQTYGEVAINSKSNYTVGGVTYSGNDYAAGIQLALWELSINTTSGSKNFAPTSFTESNEVWSSGNPNTFSVTGISDKVGGLTNYLLNDAAKNATGNYNVGWLDASANGSNLDRGQSLLVATPAPAPSSSVLLILGSALTLIYFGWQRRKIAAPATLN